MLKKSMFIVVLLLLLGPLVNPIFAPVPKLVEAQTSNNLNNVTVTGLGEVVSAPDVAIIQLGVESLGKNLKELQQENATKTQAVIASLVANNVPKENIKTIQYQIFKRYDYNNAQKFLGYTISNMLEVKTKELDNISTLINDATASGANTFSNVTFKIEDTTKLYLEALEKAMLDAKGKFSALTGKTTYSLIQIVEESQMFTPMFDTFNKASLENGARDFISKGENTIRATIRVVFSY